MDFKTMAAHMLPFWIMGLLVVIATILAGQKNLFKVYPSALWKFTKFLAIVTLWRVVLFKLLGNAEAVQNAKTAMSVIPIGATLFVPWEDACHTLPLFLCQKLLGTDKWWNRNLNRFLVGFVMLAFGIGHVYQGILPAMLISLYIPFTLKYAKQYGFGTIMCCHVMFDMATILTIKYLLGA